MARPRAGERRAGCGPRALGWLAVIYSVALVALGILGMGVAERWWLGTLAAYLPQWPFAACGLALAALCALLRTWRPSVAVALSSAIFYAVCCGFAVGSPQPSEPGALRVLTYNVHGGRGGLDALAETILRERPHIACLQEADWPEKVRAFPQEMAGRLKGYRCFSSRGLMVASRIPMLRTRTELLSKQSEFRPALVVTARLGDAEVTVVCVHFANGRANQTLFQHTNGLEEYFDAAADIREAQAVSITNLVGRIDGPLVVCGDFNTPPRGQVYDQLAAVLTDSYREAAIGLGCTYPSNLPMLRIDYIWHNRHAEALQSRVINTRASDHRPVVAEIALD
ncbi:MAG: endonuclease/exonuclease/phosphatase family protein [Armatimonadetes bacterium]|nr:endonuclease/exonuclease/phosphatase family protein [Armatimonadota bacterium]